MPELWRHWPSQAIVPCFVLHACVCNFSAPCPACWHYTSPILLAEGAYDVEGDALQGGDAMFYFKSPPSPGPDPGSGQGSAGGTADGGARPGRGKGKAEEDRGTVRGEAGMAECGAGCDLLMAQM